MEILSDSCKTKYPILLVHGTGFRDRKHINYWGRIPKYLQKHGAEIFYGRQDSWGNIKNNAAMIRQSIKEYLNNSQSEKINIIAHSKGGLEARYLISTMNMSRFVASLTTISTPHHGSMAMERFYDIPKFLYKTAAFFVNLYSRICGDKKPDFYRGSRQMSIRECRVFNRQNPDYPGIFYQSYSAKMRNSLSDLLYLFFYPIIKSLEGDNDGLVSVDSAKWGKYKGCIYNEKWRGISHSDSVDAWRCNLAGFDIREVYKRIVNELKTAGF